MSDQAERLSGKLALDTTDFKTAIAGINRELRVVESGFKASASALGDWSSTASGLEMRIGALNDKIGLQQAKVSALRGEYERVVAEKGANSRAAQDLEIRINNETAALNGMQNELGATQSQLDGMGAEAEGSAGAVEDLGEQSNATAGLLNGLGVVAAGLGAALAAGTAAVAAMAGAVMGVGQAVTDLVLDTAEMSGELVDMSVKTGVSTERLQELAYVGDQLGTSQETIVSSLTKLTRSMSSAQGGTGAAAEAFAALGVSVTNSDGSLRDSEAVFADALTALGGIGNEAERDAMAMDIFGKSATELNPLIVAGAGEMARLSEEANQVGAVMSGENVAAMATFKDTVDSLGAGLQGTLGTLAGAFLPGFQGLASQAQGYLTEFSAVVTAADGDFGAMAAGIGDLIGRIAGDLAEQAPQMVEAALTLIQTLINVIIETLPELLPAAIGIIHSLVGFIVANLPTLVNAAVQIIMTIVNGLLPQLPRLIEAAIRIIVALALGIAQALPQLIPTIVGIIPQIVVILLQNLPLLIGAAIQIIGAILTGLIEAIPQLTSQAPQIIDAIVEALRGSMSTIIEVGGAVVAGVWTGIKNAGPKLAADVKKFFTGIVDGVKKLLGIASPSIVFAGIGRNMSLGMAQGFGAESRRTQQAIQAAVGGIAGATAGNVYNQTTYNLTAQYAYQSAGSLAEDVRLLQLLNG